MSVFLQRLRWMITGFNNNKSSSAVSPKRRLENPDVKNSDFKAKIAQLHSTVGETKEIAIRRPMLEAVHEIAIYVHRFHNLDLFQQGWYQLKISMRWEDNEGRPLPTPARVVQYEAPDLGCDDIYGVWRIDDTDHSFSTQPFRIRYARQDILLSMMVSFNLPLGDSEGPPNSAVMLKFELLYTPVLENRYNIQACLNESPAAVHEFRLPPKALLGLHAYCPVHFDAFHAVLVDTSIHATMLKSGIYMSSLPTLSVPRANGTAVDHENQKQVMLCKALSSARDILLGEFEKLGKAINQSVDLQDVTQSPEKESNETEVALSEDELQRSFDAMGDRLFYLWSTFLSFHRANTKKILEFLHDQWAVDRKAEWSIWMVHTKAEMPHQYISSVVNDSSYHGLHGRAPVLRKLNGDPAQTAATRAELHRRSIAQMRINNQSIQDLHIFGDPSRIPVVIVERVTNAPVRSSSGHSYSNEMDQKSANGSSARNQSARQNGRVLKIVVFVHGFQGHHLDLRLVRNQWLLIDPKAKFLMSEANEDKTSGDFREMGHRLAQEVVSFVKKKMDKASRSGNLSTIKLSFVGHSIGNIILRTALTDSIMEPYLRFLHTYLSVSGPHLGYLYSSNSLFNGGLWLLKKFKGTPCIHQLTFTDDPDLQNTFLYKLCKQKTLEHFKNIVLLSSPQDGYVPYHSARIEMSPASSGDYSKKGKIFLEMLNDCLDQIRAPSSEPRVFMRCDVNFNMSLQGRNLNTMIGRAAHIEFLETDIFARFIMWSFPDLFR